MESLYDLLIEPILPIVGAFRCAVESTIDAAIPLRPSATLSGQLAAGVPLVRFWVAGTFIRVCAAGPSRSILGI